MCQRSSKFRQDVFQGLIAQFARTIEQNYLVSGSMQYALCFFAEKAQQILNNSVRLLFS